MTSNHILQCNPHWEQLRFNLSNFARAAQTPKHTAVFQPGDVASCNGSIQHAFFHLLAGLGYRLQPSKGEKLTLIDVKSPLRYCVINRHIEGQLYEVYLLTTFGGARNLRNLDSVGQYFAMPMGSTQWTDNIPGIWTNPPIFGAHTPSFLFAIPTIRIVHPTEVRARVPQSELRRVAKYFQTKIQARVYPAKLFFIANDMFLGRQTLPENHWPLRQSLRDRRWDRSEWSGDDTFAPAQEELHIASDGTDVAPFVKPYRSHLEFAMLDNTLRFPLPPPNDIRWLLRHSRTDMVNTSRYYPQTRISKLRHLSLPKPYYAACLRVAPSNVRHLIR